jgi:hypothetical protein
LADPPQPADTCTTQADREARTTSPPNTTPHMTGGGLLVVSGASGAGKSSLLRAGVLPRLRGAGLAAAPGAASWPCLVFTPGRVPLDELAVRVAVLAGVDSAAVRRELEADPAGFALTAQQAALAQRSAPDRPPGRLAASESHQSQRHLLLMVDQFEQVFTQCADDGHRQAFVTALCAAAGIGQEPGGRIRQARRVDGSSGDGGRDCHFTDADGTDVYELKSFTGRMGRTQRRQEVT